MERRSLEFCFSFKKKDKNKEYIYKHAKKTHQLTNNMNNQNGTSNMHQMIMQWVQLYTNI